MFSSSKLTAESEPQASEALKRSDGSSALEGPDESEGSALQRSMLLGN